MAQSAIMQLQKQAKSFYVLDQASYSIPLRPLYLMFEGTFSVSGRHNLVLTTQTGLVRLSVRIPTGCSAYG